MVKNSNINDVLVIGAGAIGGITAAILSKGGIDVQVLTRKGPHFDAIKKNGLIIEGHQEIYHFPVYSNIKDIKNKFNHILVAVKNTSTEDVAKQLKNVLLPTTLVYSLQNGFGNTDILAKYLPKEQIVAGVVGWGATYLGNGWLRITSSTGDFILGFENGRNKDDQRLLDIKKKLDLWKETILTNNILGYRWAKLIVNSVIAPFGGLLGETVGNMLGNPEISPLMGALKNEGIQVADANNIILENVDGLNIRNFFYKPKPEDGFFTKVSRSLMSTIIAKAGAKRHGKIYPSLLVDLQRGLKTEIDFLNGYIERKGKESNLETPINSFLVKAIKEIENGKRKIGMENLGELKQVAEYSRKKIEEQEKR
ncbi:MAG: ketopantoate reductase family protein [Candidatus Thorarchaeota archaeon]